MELLIIQLLQQVEILILIREQGKARTFIYIIQKIKKAGPPISKLGSWDSRHDSVGRDFVHVRNTSGEVEDANNGVSGSSYVFLTYECDEEDFDKSAAQTSYKVYEDPNNVPTGKVIYKKLVRE